MTSSIYPIVITGQTGVGGTDLFTPNIVITREMVSPGGGGILRLWFSFSFTIAGAPVQVFKGTTQSPTLVFKGNLNPDNDAVCLTNGYYRFDIDVEEGDIINLQSTQTVTANNLIRAHLVVFGA